MSSENHQHPIGTCPHCGKLCWTSKKIAKSAAKRAHPAEHLSVYKCDSWWHYGHLNYSTMHAFGRRGV